MTDLDNPTFTFSQRSLAELRGVHPDLVAVVNRALELSEIDFAVHDGIRTEAEQGELVRRGASRTMKSDHLTGHAVDLVPVINGKLRWEWQPIYLIAEAMRTAARELGVRLEWGGHWGEELTATDDIPALFVRRYVEKRRAMGRSAFIDGPHFCYKGKL
ncbi:MAG: M15 family metallopeptidase [Blastocatellia bacterium]|nr:M15 family metallopeptidase [Blastocatellia bacterium]